MKRRLIISFCAAVFLFGIIGILNRTPNVDVGIVTLASGVNETELKGYEIASLRNGKAKAADETPDIKTLASDVTAVAQTVMKNNGSSAVRVNTNMSVAFTGKYVDDVNYTVFTTEGEQISEPAAALSLPTKDLDACIVRIDVKWGRTKNYKEYYYFFRVDFNKEA